MRRISLLLIFSLLMAFNPVVFAGDKTLTDDHLVDKVRLKLAGDPEVKGGALEVEVKNGVVTLRGSVRTEKAKLRATKVSKRIEGVKDVVNEIKVKP